MKTRTLVLMAFTLVSALPAAASNTPPKRIAFSTYLGGEYFDYAADLAVDVEGNTYVVGTTESAGFRVTANATQPLWGGLRPNPQVLAPIPNRRQDAFVAKLDPGGSLVYSTYLGGTSTDAASAVAVDAAGNAYVTGVTSAADFPTKDAFQPAGHGTSLEAFVTKLTPTGSIAWSTYLGTAAGPGQPAYAGDDFATAIAVDASGRVAVVGWTESTEFPTTDGSAKPDLAGGSPDAWVAVFSPDGKRLEYGSYLGGSAGDAPTAVAFGTLEDDGDPETPRPVAAKGDLIVAGYTVSEDFPVTAGAYDTTFEGTHDPRIASEGSDSFVAGIPLGGGPISYGTFFGGGEGEDVGDGFFGLPEERIADMAITSDGRIYATGYAQSLDMPTTPGAFQSKRQDKEDKALFEGGDGFVFALEPTGRALEYATYLGAESTDVATGLAVDSAGRAHVIGFTESRAFPVTNDAFQARRSNEDRRDVYNEAVCLGPAGPVIGQLAGEKFCETLGLMVVGDSMDDFVAILDPQGRKLDYATYAGGSGVDLPLGIGLSTGGVITFGGYTEASNFPTRRAAQPVLAGVTDATITRFSPTEPPPCSLELGPVCLNGT